METLNQLIVLIILGIIIYGLFIYQKKLSIVENNISNPKKSESKKKSPVDHLKAINNDYENLSQCTIGSLDDE